MDIQNYIGLYLFKNDYCYIHGLGNLELVKIPAQKIGEEIKGPHYQVRLTNQGSIDDSFANFIANREQVSIANAANAIREFSTSTRQQLLEGNEVEIPGVGHFVQLNDKPSFRVSPNLQYAPPPIPSIKISQQVMDRMATEKPDPLAQPQEYHSAGTSVNLKTILIALLVIVLVGVGIYLLLEMQKSNAVKNKPTTSYTEPETEHTQNNTNPVSQESTIEQVAPTQSPAAGTFEVIINEYPTAAAAEKRSHKLNSYGNVTTTFAKDSTAHLVLVVISGHVNDTTRVVDSLRRVFNPNGNVRILHR